MASASLVLDRPPSDLALRLSNKIYEACRTGRLQLNAFPDFQTPINALRAGHQTQEPTTFQVCKQQGQRLVILESFASKFLEADCVKDETVSLIKAHNLRFNPDGDFLQSDRPAVVSLNPCPTGRKSRRRSRRLRRSRLNTLGSQRRMS